MELERLTIDGFRGLYADIEFAHNTVITAGNGKGKSTILNALLWLFCGVDEADRSNYNLFDNKLPQDDPSAPLSASVSAVFDAMTIARTAIQSWGKDKNSGGFIRKGDDYKYLVNDMEVSATRFKEIIEAEIMPIDKLKFVLNVHRWEIIGETALREKIKDLAPADLKPADSRYDSVMWAIAENGVAGAKKHYAKRSKEYQHDAEKLNIEIMATRKRMPPMADAEPLKASLDKAQAEYEEVSAHMAASIPTGLLQKRQDEEQRIYQLKLDIQTAKFKYDSDNKAKLVEAEAKFKNTQRLRDDLRFQRDRIADLEQRVAVARADYEQKAQEYKRLLSRQFTGLCPNCGQSLAGASRAEQLAAFKAQKAQEEALIIDEGKAIAKRRDCLVDELEGAKRALEETKLSLGDATRLEQTYELAKRRCEIAFEDTDEYKQLEADLKRLQANRTEMPTDTASEEDKARKGNLLTKIQQLQSDIVIAERDATERQRLEADLKRLEAKREAALRKVTENEKSLSLAKEYESEWMRMLEDEINSQFSGVRVQMNDVSKTGEAVECCKIRMADVKDTLNNASRVMVGIEIAEAFQNKYGVDLPLIVDNAESIERDRIKTDHQLILLRMVDGQELKVEN